MRQNENCTEFCGRSLRQRTRTKNQKDKTLAAHAERRRQEFFFGLKCRRSRRKETKQVGVQQPGQEVHRTKMKISDHCVPKLRWSSRTGLRDTRPGNWKNSRTSRMWVGQEGSMTTMQRRMRIFEIRCWNFSLRSTLWWKTRAKVSSENMAGSMPSS